MELKLRLSGRHLQFLCAFLVNFHSMVYALVIIWPSPALPVLMSEASPLPSGQISVEEASLISSTPYFGGLVGTLVLGYMGKRFGQKRIILFATILELIAALLIIFAENVIYLDVSRFLSGFAGGAIQLIVAYVCEVSEDSVRGILGSFLGIIDTIGVLLGAIVGAYLSFYAVPYIHLVMSGISLLFVFFPDSPQILLLHNKFPEAERSFNFFRRLMPKEKIDEEFNRLKESIVNSSENSQDKVTFDDFKKPSTIKALLICVVMLTGRQATGMGILLNFNGIIYEETGMEMGYNVGTIIYSLIQVISLITISLFIDKLGRRPQLIGSLMSTFICFIPLAVFFYAQSLGIDVSAFSGWVPLVFLSCIAGFSMGLIHTPTVIMGEILPTKLRGTVVLIIYLMMRIETILTMQFFLPIIDKFGIHPCLIAFAIWALLEAIFIYFYLPETKGRNIDDIVKTLTDKRGNRNVSDS